MSPSFRVTHRPSLVSDRQIGPTHILPAPPGKQLRQANAVSCGDFPIPFSPVFLSESSRLVLGSVVVVMAVACYLRSRNAVEELDCMK